jgi:SAM-dependent methyltransferase
LKRLILKIADVSGLFWRFLPARLRLDFFVGLVVLESRDPNPGDGLRRLLALKDKLEWVINERALAYGQGEHPKHRLIGYHNFFINRINDGERVLDVGCGYGAVARSIAKQRPNCIVLGMDFNTIRLEQAKSAINPPNLNFLSGDVTQEVPLGGWDVVILSNVLEHIDGRRAFLRALLKASMASRILIRVPLFERDWQMPLRRELGIEYYSDADHKIEHQLDELYGELNESGIEVVEVQTLWGEIWVNCVFNQSRIQANKKHGN